MNLIKNALLVPVYAVFGIFAVVMTLVGMLAGLLAYIIAGGIMLFLLRLVLGAL